MNCIQAINRLHPKPQVVKILFPCVITCIALSVLGLVAVQEGMLNSIVSGSITNPLFGVLLAVSVGILSINLIWHFSSQWKVQVLRNVACDGLALRYASEELKNDREVVLEAVREVGGSAFQFASDELRGDREFILQAVREVGGSAFQFASEELRGDREFILQAVRQYGFVLEYASDELRGDREVVLEAVRQKGSALKFASDELRGDREVVSESVRQNGDALEYATAALQTDPELKALALGRLPPGGYTKSANKT